MRSASRRTNVNNERRKSLQAIQAKLEEAKSELETLRDEEQEYYDNMPESLQGGDKGNAALDAFSNIEYAISDLESAVSNIESATAS